MIRSLACAGLLCVSIATIVEDEFSLNCGTDAVGCEPLCADLFENFVAESPKASSERWGSRSEPAVISGIAITGKWDSTAFSRANLKDEFGRVPVKIFSPPQAALLQGVTTRIHPLGVVLDKPPSIGRDVYVFDRDFFSKSPRVRAAAPVPASLALDGSSQFFAFGAASAGVQFHVHGANFFALLKGNKRWYFHPPGEFPNKTVKSLDIPVFQWEREVLPQLDLDRPTSCRQRSSETLFIPGGWAHATVNIDETIGLAWQLPTPAKKNCDFGFDYICLCSQLSALSASADSTRKRGPDLFQVLFDEAESMTGGSPAPGLINFLGPFLRYSSTSGGRALQKYLDYVKLTLENAIDLDQRILAAAMTKALSDAAYVATQNHRHAAAILAAAANVVPVSGVGKPLAQHLAADGDWVGAAKALELHVRSFPHDRQALLMLAQARERSATQM